MDSPCRRWRSREPYLDAKTCKGTKYYTVPNVLHCIDLVDNPTFFGFAPAPGFGVEDAMLGPICCPSARRPCNIRAYGDHAVYMHARVEH